jgi:hypothetical protein
MNRSQLRQRRRRRQQQQQYCHPVSMYYSLSARLCGMRQLQLKTYSHFRKGLTVTPLPLGGTPPGRDLLVVSLEFLDLLLSDLTAKVTDFCL